MWAFMTTHVDHTTSATRHTRRQPHHTDHCHTPCLHHAPSISTGTCQRRHINPRYVNRTTSTSTTYPKDEGTREEEDEEEMGQGGGTRRESTQRRGQDNKSHVDQPPRPPRIPLNLEPPQRGPRLRQPRRRKPHQRQPHQRQRQPHR